MSSFAAAETEDLSAMDWSSIGLFSSLKIIFTHAIRKSFPITIDLKLDDAIVQRCGNPQFGDFQCNNSLSISKAFKSVEGYTGPQKPLEIAQAIAAAVPANPLVEAAIAAPNGFINIKIRPAAIISSIAGVSSRGLTPPKVPKQKVLVDFSSPNIAKEMHVGHLRSTIIGDTICRIMEYCGHDVMRVNHVGDWGTQFGMLIQVILEDEPTFIEDRDKLDIAKLTKLYKRAKERFDTNETFKEKSRLNVVKLQAGDELCRSIWTTLCHISRIEFQNVYDALDIKLEEFGESYYNNMIPGTIDILRDAGLIELEGGAKIVKLPHFNIPLMLQKSDGGYGYDSTDMAAIRYRLQSLERDWIVYITDAGQADHFHMCFDVAKAAGWMGDKRVDHIGFGVVQGPDGKRFKTRSSETVKLIDLLNEAAKRMEEGLITRVEEGKSDLSAADLVTAAKVIGYGAVKYADLKNNPATNYMFSYDKMLDTKGDTAVYLMFAYARVSSIIRKAPEKGFNMETIFANAESGLVLDHVAERNLAFELLQMNDVIKVVLSELNPCKLCDFLKEVCVKFSEFVTKCHVLNADSEAVAISRLILCESTRRVLEKCFHLLGIQVLDRI